MPLTASDVRQILEGEIIAHKWAPGQRLPSERQLSERFGVSRPAVREILRNLSAQGLILAHPGRGSFVRELTPTKGEGSVGLFVRRGAVTPRHLVAARQMLETESATMAAVNHTREDSRRMRELVGEFDAATDIEAAAGLDVALHEAIAIASGNPVVQIMFGSIHELVRGISLRSLADPKVRAVGAPMHHTIVDAIIRGDGAVARAAMTKHVMLAIDLYGDDLDRPLSEVLRHGGWKLELGKTARSRTGARLAHGGRTRAR